MLKLGSRPGRRALVVIGIILPVLCGVAARHSEADSSASTAGAKLASLRLQDADGKFHKLGDFEKGKATVIACLGLRCPVANYYVPEINRIVADYAPRGVQLIAVDVDPDSSKADLAAHSKSFDVHFPMLWDPQLKAARLLGATTMSQVFLLDSTGQVQYSGRVDDTFITRFQKKNTPPNNDLRNALDAVLDGKPAPVASTTPIGCLIPQSQVAPAHRAAAITYSHDIEPMLRENCVSCHYPGQIAPFSLLTYADAKQWGQDLKDVTARKVMPPWKPVDDHDQFLGKRQLTDQQVQTLARWVDDGMPSGNLKTVPPPPKFTTGWMLGQPDLVLTPSKPYHVEADGRDIYRCFVIPTNLPQDTYISAIEYHPSNRRIVHHCLGYLDTQGRARERDGKETEPGYTSFGGPGFTPDGEMGGWAPGNDPIFLPDGVARKLPKGADFVLQVHYHKDGKPEEDQTSVGLYFSKKPVDHMLHTFMVVHPQLRIDPGDANYQVEATVATPFSGKIITVTPHMHLLGKQVQMDMTLPDGTKKSLVRINDWDFNWQGTYEFKDAIDVPQGTKITLKAVYDNSTGNPRNPNSPPKQVHWGEGTNDEMCIGFIGFIRDDSKPEAGILSGTISTKEGRLTLGQGGVGLER